MLLGVFYIIFIILAFCIICEVILKINLKLIFNITFWLKFSFSFLVLIIDFCWFLVIIINTIFSLLLHYFFDYFIGRYFAAYYTERSSARIWERANNDFNNPHRTNKQSLLFDYNDLEYVYIKIRLLQFFRQFYLMVHLSIKLIKNFIKFLFLKFFNDVLIYYIFYYILYIFWDKFRTGFMGFLEYIWIFILKIRTHIFLMIYHEYIYIVYKRFSVYHQLIRYYKGIYDTYNEDEPTYKLYKALKIFQKDEHIIYKDNLYLINFKFIWDLILNFYFFIFYKPLYLTSFFLLKCSYYLEYNYYKIILFQDWSKIFNVIFFWLKLILYYIILKIQNLNILYILNVFKPFKKLLNIVAIILNTCLLNIITTIIRILPKIFFFFFRLKTWLFIICVLYYVELDLILNFSSYFFFDCIKYYTYVPESANYFFCTEEILQVYVTVISGGAYPTVERHIIDVTWPVEYFIDGWVIKSWERYHEIKVRGVKNFIFWKMFIESILSFKHFKIKHKRFWKRLRQVFKYTWARVWYLVIPWKYAYMFKRLGYIYFYLIISILNCLSMIPLLWYYFYFRVLIPRFIFELVNLILKCTYYVLNFLINKSFLGLSWLYLKITAYDWPLFIERSRGYYLFSYYRLYFLFKRASEFLHLWWIVIYITNNDFIQIFWWYKSIIFFDLLNFKFITSIELNENFMHNILIYKLTLHYIYYILCIKFSLIKSSIVSFNSTENILRNFIKFYFYFWNLFQTTVDHISLSYEQFRLRFYERYEIDILNVKGRKTRKRKKFQIVRYRRFMNYLKRINTGHHYYFNTVPFSMFTLWFFSDFLFREKGYIALWEVKKAYSDIHQKDCFILSVEYLLVAFAFILFFSIFSFFRNFLGKDFCAYDPEYCWKRFRNDSEVDNVKWVFADLNYYVKDFLKNKKLKLSKQFGKELEYDSTFIDFLDTLQKDIREGEDHIKSFDEVDNLWRPMWVENFLEKLKVHTYKNFFNTKFTFASFYFDPKYEKFHRNIIINNLFFQAFLLYGLRRHKFVELASLNEGYMIPLNIFWNDFYLQLNTISDSIKKYYYELDEKVYNHSLPMWCYHKDTSFTSIVSTKLGEEDENGEEQFFFIDNPLSIFVYVSFWFMLIPTFFIRKLTITWPKYFIVVRHEWYLYLIGYAARFNVINEMFEFYARVHWTDLFSDRRKGSTQSIHRRKMKRRYRLRVKYAYACTNWGDFCIWRIRKAQRTFYEKNLTIILTYFKNISIYFAFVLVMLYFNYVFFKKALIMNFKKVNMWKLSNFRNLLKLKLYYNIIFSIKHKFNINDKA